ncbi:MAG TPA: hypothetical protein VFP72_22265, partial [Kineosporiaceae bacterium]|nr:hypothetical protein [Kineosporiaceae bacterium]
MTGTVGPGEAGAGVAGTGAAVGGVLLVVGEAAAAEPVAAAVADSRAAWGEGSCAAVPSDVSGSGTE